MTALIFNYFESRIPIPGEEKIYKYKCKVCMLLNETDKNGEPHYVRTHGETTSNLITHMEKASHSIQFDQYIEKMKNSKFDINSPANKKRKLDYTQGSPKTPSAASQNSFFNKISSTPKYSLQSILQKTR